MTTHRLKIFVKYADAIMSGAKTFEIHKNDRDYEVGDSIVFNVVADDCHSFEEAVRHPLNGATYRIDYILDDFEGLSPRSTWRWPYPRRTNERAEAQKMPVLRRACRDSGQQPIRPRHLLRGLPVLRCAVGL